MEITIVKSWAQVPFSVYYGYDSSGVYHCITVVVGAVCIETGPRAAMGLLYTAQVQQLEEDLASL